VQPDPSYLSHWGEFGTLKNCLASYFNPDWALDFDTVEAAWSAIGREEGPDELARLIEQLEALLQRPADEIHALFRDTVEGLYFIEAADTKSWLEDFKSHLISNESHGA
jgi:hypothetical protein